MKSNSGKRHGTVRASYYDEFDLENEEFELGNNQESGDELTHISFGALKSAQQKMARETKLGKMGRKKVLGVSRNTGGAGDSDLSNFSDGNGHGFGYGHGQDSSDEDSDSDEDSEDDDLTGRRTRNQGRNDGKNDGNNHGKNQGKNNHNKKNKHAPRELSARKPVPKIRDVMGVERSSQHRDIRFDPAFGKADPAAIRKNYAFLDEYRQQEMAEMKQLMKTNKHLSEFDRQKLDLKMLSLRSKMDALKNRDLENQVVSDYKRQQSENIKAGKQTAPYFLKKSDKRKLIQKAKFEGMKASQREKVMERKRKRRLGKELRQLEHGSGQH